MSARVSVIELPEKKSDSYQHDRSDSIQVQSKKIADFDAAIQATGYGKFHYLLYAAIIPASWASSFDTTNISLILPSAECDLELTLFHKGVLNAIVYVGMVMSALLWGYLADVKGRRGILLYGFLADGIFNVFSGFSQNFWTLVFFKFISGFIVSGPYATIMTYVSEFYRTKDRGRIPLLVGFSVSFGCVANAALAWLVVPHDWSIVLGNGTFVYNSWRLFLSLCGVPTLMGVVCLYFFPESPRFLMSQGRNEEALEVFRMMYRVNTGKPAENYPIQELMDETPVTKPAASDLPESQLSQKSAKSCFKDGIRQMSQIFFYPHLPRLMLVISLQFGGMLALNTLRLWQPQLFTMLDNFDPLQYNITNYVPSFCEVVDLSTQADVAAEMANKTVEQLLSCQNSVVSDSVYTDTVIVATATIFFIMTAGIFVNLLGHKYLLFICYGVSLLCVVSMNWSVDVMVTLVLACLFIGLLSTTVNVVIGAAVLLFPTTLRTMAVSLTMMFGRTGSVIGNLVFPILLECGCLAPIITLAVFCSLTIVLACFLPNTRKKTSAIAQN